eukprot:352516-Chlamydomonas_euryale.AAC.4
MAPLVDRHVVHVPLGCLDEALTVFGAAIRKQHACGRGAIVRVDHLEHVGAGLAERVDGVLHRHGRRTLQEVAQQAVHHGRVQDGLLQHRRQRLSHVLVYCAALCRRRAVQQLRQPCQPRRLLRHAVKQHVLAAVELGAERIALRRRRGVVEVGEHVSAVRVA